MNATLDAASLLTVRFGGAGDENSRPEVEYLNCQLYPRIEGRCLDARP